MTTVDEVYFWGTFDGNNNNYVTYGGPVLIPNLGTGGFPTPLGPVTFINGEDGWCVIMVNISGTGIRPYGIGGNNYNVLNQLAQAGNPPASPPNYYLTPTPLVSPDGTSAYSWPGATLPFIQIEGGGNFLWALDSAGACFAWGHVVNGNMGNDNSTTDPQAIPTQVYAVGSPSGASKLVLATTLGVGTISGGASHMIGITPSGGVVCCGDDTYGQCGDGQTNTTNPIPVTVLGGAQGGTDLANIVQVTAGDVHSGARDSSGGVWLWGANNFGELGDNTTTNRSTPVAPAWSGSAPTITQLSCGGSNVSTNTHTLALDSTGQPWGWGANVQGQLGIGSFSFTAGPSIPQKCLVGPVVGGAQIVAVSAGGDHSLALDANGHLWGWGDYTYLGKPSLRSNVDTPTDLTSILPSAAVINSIWAGNKTSIVRVTVPVVTGGPTKTGFVGALGVV